MSSDAHAATLAIDAATLVGLLAEPARLRVFAALTVGASTAAEVVAATGLSARDAAAAIGKLQAGGLVDAELNVRVELFKEAARVAAPAAAPGDVLSRFVRDGTLLSFPAAHATRRAVLEVVAESFEIGRRYPERVVNEKLQAWTDGGAADHVTLRRYLVDHGLLDRGDGEYWRSG